MKRLFYIALTKPRKSKCWLPMMPSQNNSVLILSMKKKRCQQEAEKWLDNYVLNDCQQNRFKDPREWHIKIASVSV